MVVDHVDAVRMGYSPLRTLPIDQAVAEAEELA